MNEPLIAAHMTQNSEQASNKLPLDVLANIFSIGEELERSDWRAVKYDTPFRQPIMVCTYWRQVAITMSILWTYLRITDSPYDQIVPVYLARAGPSALLDIDLGTYATTSSRSGSHRCRDSAEDISYILHALNFLISNGAIPDRWRSLLVCSECCEALPALVGFLNSKSAPNLRFLSFRLRSSARREVDMSTIAEHTSAAGILGHWQTSVPNLRHLELALVPSAFIFNHSLSPCAGLTALDIDVADTLCSTIEMHKVLSANRGLKFLALRFGSVFDATNWPTSNVQLTPEQVLLPQLEDFIVVMADEYVSWARAMVQIVGAPALQSFQISCPRMASYQSKKLVRYITSGSPTRSNITTSTSSSSNSIYPLLRALDISDFPCTPKYLVRLLSAFPLVTEISIAGTQARWLSKLNWLLPRISKLRVTKPGLSSLAPLLARWAREGPLVKTLHVQTLQWRLDGQLESPESIAIIAPTEQYTKTEGHSYRNHAYLGLKQETESYSGESDENEWNSGSEVSEEDRVYRHGWCGTNTASNVIIDASDSEWFE